MKQETLKRLQSADDPTGWEFPVEFDWDEAMSRVRRLKPKIEQLPLTIIEQVIKATENHGFIYVNADELNQPYTGRHEDFQNDVVVDSLLRLHLIAAALHRLNIIDVFYRARQLSLPHTKRSGHYPRFLFQSSSKSSSSMLLSPRG